MGVPDFSKPLISGLIILAVLVGVLGVGVGVAVTLIVQALS